MTGRALGVNDDYVELRVVVGGEKPEPEPDTESPVVSLLASGSEGSDGWYSSDVNLRVRAIDNVNEYFNFTLQIGDAGPITAADVPFFDHELTLEGEHAVVATATDTAGNIGEVERTIKIDKTAPALAKDWGAWPKVGEQWAALTWDTEITTDSIALWWYRDSSDTTRGGVIPPKSWLLEYRDGDEWAEVELVYGEYGRASDTCEVITFEPVTTTELRIRAQSWGEEEGEGSIGIREWQVAAASDSGGEPSEPEMDVTLEAGVRCTASKVFVTGLLTNGEEVDAEVVLRGAFGAKNLRVSPGKNGFHAFTTRASEVPSGEITAAVSAENDGETITINLSDSYDALSCS